jgi:LPS sulfotransferase NodH
MRETLRIPAGVAFTGFRDWRDYIVKAAAEPNGVFAATVHWFQFGRAVDLFKSDDPRAPETPIASLRAFFPELRLIWLRRDNLVAQAISHFVAISTNVWSRRQPSSALADHLAAYDFDRIDWQVKSAIVATEGWRGALAEAPELTLPLTYEELSADLDATVRKVFAHLCLPMGDKPLPPPVLQKQAGEWSLELERRYREERRSRGMGPVGDEDRI